jgi:hypothetical protein
MGLLDDAIREHLDLKRRRGADPSEIAREESEALGPVRREAPSEDAPPPAAFDHEAPALDEPAAAYDDDFDDVGSVALDRDDHAEHADRPRSADPPTTHDDVWAEPEEESATPPHGDPLAHQATREFSATELGDALGRQETPAAPPSPTPAERFADDRDADADADAGAEADPDDELEDTPDFLQETPEHDRLWFEQKPPKDFDF